LGWFIRAAIRASSRNMCTNSVSLDRCGKSSFSATRFSNPPSPSVRAMKTSPMPPAASRVSSSYRPARRPAFLTEFSRVSPGDANAEASLPSAGQLPQPALQLHVVDDREVGLARLVGVDIHIEVGGSDQRA